ADGKERRVQGIRRRHPGIALRSNSKNQQKREKPGRAQGAICSVDRRGYAFHPHGDFIPQQSCRRKALKAARAAAKSSRGTLSGYLQLLAEHEQRDREPFGKKGLRAQPLHRDGCTIAQPKVACWCPISGRDATPHSFFLCLSACTCECSVLPRAKHPSKHIARSLCGLDLHRSSRQGETGRAGRGTSNRGRIGRMAY